MGPVAGILAALALIAAVGFSGGAVNFFFPESAAPEAMDFSQRLPLVCADKGQDNREQGDKEGGKRDDGVFVALGEVKNPNAEVSSSEDERATDGLILLLFFGVIFGGALLLVLRNPQWNANINDEDKNKRDD